MTHRVISRAEWGARERAGFDSAGQAWELFLHHSVTIAPDLVWVDANGDGVDDDEQAAMRTIERIGQERFGGGFPYGFGIPPSGRIYEGTGPLRQGAHTYGHNLSGAAIVLIGDYSTRAPTMAQQAAVAWLVAHGYAQGWWSAQRLTGGHRDATPPDQATACPGDAAEFAIPAINDRIARADFYVGADLTAAHYGGLMQINVPKEFGPDGKVNAGQRFRLIAVPMSRAHNLIVAAGGAPVKVQTIFNWAESNGTGGNVAQEVAVSSFRAKPFPIPRGTGNCTIYFTSTEDFVMTLDPQ